MMEIYFHVGLGKTGTKYLQYDFFPKLKGIYYIKPKRYRKSKEIIKKKKNKRKILISREFDVQLEKETRWFAKDFKDTKAIIVLRRQDEWIFSQFKRFVKNGYTWTFYEFFNLENTGFFKVEDLYFYKKIEILVDVFNSKPLVLLYDELKHHPFRFLDKIASFTGTTYRREYVPLRRRHVSYSEKQLKVLYTIAKRVDIRQDDNLFKRYLYIYPVRYPLLYLARFFPDKWIPEIDIFPDEKVLIEIRNFYKDDWEKCVAYSSSFY